MKNFIAYSLLLLCSLLIVQCSSTSGLDGTPSKPKTKKRGSKLINPDPVIDLTDHLRTLTGVRVTGQDRNAIVSIRQGSIKKNNALFIVNGRQLINYADAYDLVSRREIESIEVLKDIGDTGIYGVRGANGVVKIKMR